MKGRSYLDKIGAKKENHVFSVKILEKILDNGKDKDGWYDSTGTNPLYKDRTISYKVAEGVSGDKPENLEFGKPSEGLGAFSFYYLSKKLKSNLSIYQY